MSEVQTPTPKSGSSRRGVRIALVVSLMVNLLLIGVLVGGFMRVSHMRPPAAAPDMRALWLALPQRARDQMRVMAMGPGAPDHRVSREERHARRLENNARIVSLLRAMPFDPAAFSAALDADHLAMRRRMDAARMAFARQIGALTPAERQAMAAQLESEWADRLPPPAHR